MKIVVSLCGFVIINAWQHSGTGVHLHKTEINIVKNNKEHAEFE